MKLFVAFLSFSLSFGAIANALSFRTGDQTILDEKQSVPGDNPLKFCHDPSDFILTIDHVDLAPNPPVPCVQYINQLQLIARANDKPGDRNSGLKPQGISPRKSVKGPKSL
jgi:hypothetical protein